MNEYSNNIQIPKVEPNDGFSSIVTLIIIGSITIFIGLYIYNFIKGFNSVRENDDNIEDDDTDFSENYSKENYKSTVNNSIIICNYCGEENTAESNFCRNCGNKLK